MMADCKQIHTVPGRIADCISGQAALLVCKLPDQDICRHSECLNVHVYVEELDTFGTLHTVRYRDINPKIFLKILYIMS